jgi:hypothetical protein
MRQLIALVLCMSVAGTPLVVTAQQPPAISAGSEEGDVDVAELDAATEQAIERGIKFLAQTQAADGSWGGGKYPVAITSLSLMAFMLKGHFPKKGIYGEQLDKALAFLIARSKVAGGYMGVNMYEHGLATLALSEAWGMSQREELRSVLRRAVDVILTSQSHSGGWRYKPEPNDADISVTVMQIVALSSAREAGMYVPPQVLKKAVGYVKGLQVRMEGGFGYTGPQQPGFARSSAGVMSLLMAGDRNSQEVLMGLQYLRRLPGSTFAGGEHYHYGHYYAVQAMYQAGEAYYQEWYPKIKTSLLRQQKSNGAIGDGGEGQQYTTALSILILGVPYRFLPIYQR